MNDERRFLLWFVLVATLAWSICMHNEMKHFSSQQSQQGASCSYSSGQVILDLEMASSGKCFEDIIKKGSATGNVRIVQLNIHMDYGFIALYWSVFLLFALLVDRPLSKWIVGLISIAALFDLFENYRILRGLAAIVSGSASPVATPQFFSMVKWTAFALALLTLGASFWALRGGSNRMLGFTLFLSGLLMVGGPYASSLMNGALELLALGFIAAVVRYCPWRPSFGTVLVWIEYAYLMRFQILSAGILAVGLPVAYWAVPGIFEGLFDARGFRSFSLIAWAAFQLAWTIMVACRLILAYGPDRFGRAERVVMTSPGLGTVSLFGLLAVPLIAILWHGTARPELIGKVIGTALGGLLALIVLMMTAALHYAIEEEPGTTANAVFPMFGFMENPKLKASPWRFWRWVDNWLSKLPTDLTEGIVKAGHLRSGHEMALIAVVILLVLYGLTGLALSPAWTTPERQPAALFFLLFLITILTWALSGTAFLLDRFRLPVFTTLLCVSLLTGFVRTDHQFVITKTNGTAEPGLSPADVIQDWKAGPRKGKNNAVTVIATAGGGIRASAWTAEVFTRLQEHCGCRFSSSVVLVSSVSGGSLGSMFVVGPYDVASGDYPTEAKRLEAVRFNAARSSLSAIGWGLLYPDLARTIPVLGSAVPQTMDRGWSLENAWVTPWRGQPKNEPPSIGEWRKDVISGTRPAVIYNATAVENGQRFLIGSTEAPGDGTVRFSEAFPGWDMRVATAARLSATFPYVSPAARASHGDDPRRLHVVDGGYYDNSGLLTAVEWLREAGQSVEGYKVLLINIDAVPGEAKEGTAWSWQRQMTAPIETLLHVRTSSQTLRDDLELKMALEYLKQRNHMDPRAATFLFASELPVPLSWHLNKMQYDAIHKAWLDPRNDAARAAVYEQLGCPQ